MGGLQEESRRGRALLQPAPAICWIPPEGRSKFCRLNESGAFNKPDPLYPNYKIWVFNNQGEGMVIKRRSRVDPSLMEDVEFDVNGNEISRSYEPA